MEFYSMEHYEIMSDLIEDYIDWVNFEADMATHPFN